MAISGIDLAIWDALANTTKFNKKFIKIIKVKNTFLILILMQQEMM